MFTATLVAAAGVTLAAPVPKALKTPNFFPTAVGTQWEYATGNPRAPLDVWEVTESTDTAGERRVVVEVKDGQNKGRDFTYRVRDGRVSIGRHAAGNEFTPPMHTMALAPRPGDKWEAAAKPHPRVPNRVVYLIEVGDPEEVATPAGRFTAIPV